MSNTETTSTHPGQIIWKQIPVMTKMSCGARQACLTDAGIKFKVGGRMRWIFVDLDQSDTYSVKLVRVTRDVKTVTVKKFEGVYADMLGEIIYGLCNK